MPRHIPIVGVNLALPIIEAAGEEVERIRARGGLAYENVEDGVSDKHDDSDRSAQGRTAGASNGMPRARHMR